MRYGEKNGKRSYGFGIFDRPIKNFREILNAEIPKMMLFLRKKTMQ